MGNLLGISLSGLNAFQQSLETTAHNIANVDTEGFSRQRVELETQPPRLYGDNYLGTGVIASSVERYYSQSVMNSLRDTTAEYNRLDKYTNMANRLDGLLADESVGLSSAMIDFFDSVQDLANDPAAASTRQVVLSSGEALADRFNFIESRLEDMYDDINGELSSNIDEANELAETIAQMNQKILVASNKANSFPNDLMDKRDNAINRLSEIFNITTITRGDGMVNVFIGKGQTLVNGTDTSELSITANTHDFSRNEISLRSGSGIHEVSEFIEGGAVGGLLEFRSETLDKSRNDLGLIAIVMADQFNTQHGKGLNMNNELGAAFFTEPVPEVYNGSSTGAMSATITDTTLLTGDEYHVSFDGSDYTINNKTSGGTTVVAAADIGNANNIPGVTLGVAGAAAGDTFLVRPTEAGGREIAALLSDPKEIAAAAPVRTAASSANGGSAEIEFDSIPDNFAVAANYTADFASTITITFTDPTTYTISDGTTTVPGVGYTAGAQLPIVGPPPFDPGFLINITGAPAAGDVFTIEQNTDGFGDNRNALLIGDLETDKTVLSASSLQETYSHLVSSIGTDTMQANVNLDAQNAMLTNAIQTRDNLSGVNLDEEAANLMKFQQAYQATARVIQTADTIFQSVLGMFG